MPVIEKISPIREIEPITDNYSESAANNSFAKVQAYRKAKKAAKSDTDRLPGAPATKEGKTESTEAFLEAKEQSESDQAAYELKRDAVPEHCSQVETDQAMAIYHENSTSHEEDTPKEPPGNGASIDGVKDDTPQQIHHIHCID